MRRRETIKLLAGAAAVSFAPDAVRRAAEFAAKVRGEGSYEPKHFTPHECALARGSDHPQGRALGKRHGRGGP